MLGLVFAFDFDLVFLARSTAVASIPFVSFHFLSCFFFFSFPFLFAGVSNNFEGGLVEWGREGGVERWPGGNEGIRHHTTINDNNSCSDDRSIDGLMTHCLLASFFFSCALILTVVCL